MLPVGLLLQNLKVSPFLRACWGRINQLLIVPAPVVLLKLAPTNELLAPACAGNTVPEGKNHVVVPTGALRLLMIQVGGGDVSKFSVYAVQTDGESPDSVVCAFASKKPGKLKIANVASSPRTKVKEYFAFILDLDDVLLFGISLSDPRIDFTLT